MRCLSALFLFAPLLLVAQLPETKWDIVAGGNAKDKFYSLLEATNGLIVAAGETHSSTAGGADGLLIITDPSTGARLAERKLGGAKDDLLKSVVQTFYGHFIVGGQTASTGKGKTDAWILELNDKGETQWSKTFGGTGDDRFERLAILPNGDIAFAGVSNNGREGDIWVGCLRDTAILWEVNLGKGHFASIAGLITTPEGNLVLAGNLADKKGDVWLAKISDNGRLLWERPFGNKGWEECTGLIATKDGGFAFCGITDFETEGELDTWLVKTNADGFMQWEGKFGGRDIDLANAIAQTTDGGFLLTGSSRSFRSGARNTKAFFVKTDSGGKRQWQDYLGGEKDSEMTHIRILHDAGWIACGHTASKGAGAEDAWLVRWPSLIASGGALAGAKQGKVEMGKALLNSPDGLLKAGSQTYFSLAFTNTTGADLQDVQLRVSGNTGSNLNVWETNYAGSIAANTKFEFKVPVAALESAQQSETLLGLSLLSDDYVLGTTNLKITTQQPQAADVEIEQFAFEDSKTSDDQTLKVQVRNPGDYPAKGVIVRFELPNGISAVTSQKQEIGTIAAHSSKSVSFTYRANNELRGGKQRIACVVQMGGKEYRKTLEKGVASTEVIDLILTEPNSESTDLKKLVSESNVFNVKVAVAAPNPVKQQDFKVYNNNLVIDGNKMDEVDLSPGKQSNGRYHFIYSGKIHLQPGENKVEVALQTATGETKTQSMVINFQPRQPNLHVLAIGPPHEDLKYTGLDASNFAKAYENQAGPGKLYGKVFVRTLTEVQATQADALREAISDLVFQYQNPAAAERILENDVLIVFISTHGKNSRDGFLLLPSNYDARYERTRTLDYQRDLVNELEQINCKKLVFIDACQSGAADSKAMSDVERADALMKLAALHPGMSTLTSCRANELSYEDAAWENGAFTEAILEAFANKICSDDTGTYHADANDNKIVTLGELYDFLQRRVPQMVSKQKTQAPTTQTPFMPESRLSKEDMPVYVIE